MIDWSEKQAEAIVDAFMDDEGPEDLLKLKQAIVDALRLAYERGRHEHLSGRKGKGRKNSARDRLR
ncbi:MAG: hypothetical protein ACT4OO_05230 [Nitrospiraceae bacterium]